MFKENYGKKYNEEPNYVSVYGYSIGKYLSEIIIKSDGDNEKIRNSLNRLNQQSIRGNLSINSKRDVLTPIGIYKRVENDSKLISKID